MADTIDYSSTVHTRTGIVTSAGQLLPANDKRRTVIIQNLGTNPLFVKFGTGATTSDFDIILSPGTASDDGLGGTFLEDVLSYTGIISIAGTAPRATATDF